MYTEEPTEDILDQDDPFGNLADALYDYQQWRAMYNESKNKFGDTVHTRAAARQAAMAHVELKQRLDTYINQVISDRTNLP